MNKLSQIFTLMCNVLRVIVCNRVFILLVLLFNYDLLAIELLMKIAASILKGNMTMIKPNSLLVRIGEPRIVAPWALSYEIGGLHLSFPCIASRLTSF